MGSYTWRLHLLSAFFGVYFRYLLFGLSRIMGSVIRFLATGWRPIGIWLLLSAELVVVWKIFNGVMAGSTISPETIVNLEVAGAAIMLFVAGLIVYEGWKARHRVVVDAFADYSVTDPSSTNPKKQGVSNLLMIELRRLRELYDDVDERRPISSLGGRKSLLDYAIKVDDNGTVLQGALTSTTTVSLGPFTVPVGAIAGVVGYIVQGPRISGGFHCDGDLYSLTAQMYGKTAKSWRVEGRLAPADAPPADESAPNNFIPHDKDNRVILARGKEDSVKNIDPMIRELACRIFTDCTAGGSTRWRATYAFNEGIWEYRKTVYSSRDWLLNLKNAERRFLEAISDDNYFDLAYYNLGVVYTELYKRKKNREPAQKAFLSAVKHNPKRWQSYASLALNRFEMGTDYRFYPPELIADVMHHCNQALTLCQRNPKIHDLLGICHRLLAVRVPYPENQKYFIKAAENHAGGVKHAWHAICAQKFDVGTEGIEKDDSSKTCWITLWDQAQNLSLPAMCDDSATVQAMVPGFWQAFSLSTAERILLQARYVHPSNALIERELGDIYFKMGEFEKARKSFEAACRIEPSNLQNWFLLALSCKKAPGRNDDQMEIALQKVLVNPTDLYAKLSPRWKKKLWKILPDEGTWTRLREIFDFIERKEKIKEAFNINDEFNPDILIDHYNDLAARSKPDGIRTELELDETRKDLVTTAYELSLLLADKEYYGEAVEFGREAIESCTDEEVWEKGILNANLGYFYFKGGDYPHAIDSYTKAISLLEERHLGEINQRDVPLSLVHSFLSNNQKLWALNFANAAYSLNPLGFNELAAMGECWKAHNDYLKAQSAFEGALLLRPEEIQMLINIGECLWIMGDYSKELDEKENYRKKAIIYLEHIRELLDETDLETNLNLSYLIGKCYFDRAEYGKALYNLEIAAAMSDDTNEKTLIYLKQAYAYLYKRDHDQSEYWFSEIIDTIKSQLRSPQESTILPSDPGVPEESGNTRNTGPLVPPGGGEAGPGDTGDAREHEGTMEKKQVDLFTMVYPFGEKWKIGHFYIRAFLGKAYSLAERDAGLDKDNTESMDLISQAEQVYTAIAQKYPDRSIEGEIADRKGWLKYKRENLDEAEKDIRRAVSLKADSEYHLHLAYIYSSRIPEIKEPEAQNLVIRKAVAQCTHAIDMATNQDMKTRAINLKKELLSKSP
jgi:tetratricopeptide (TPR) repeat protein